MLGVFEIGAMVIVVALVAGAAWAGQRLARAKNRSTVGWAIVCAVFPPALLVLLVLPALASSLPHTPSDRTRLG